MSDGLNKEQDKTEKKAVPVDAASSESVAGAPGHVARKNSRFKLDHLIVLVAIIVFFFSTLFLVDDDLFMNYIFPRPNYDLKKIAKVSRYSNDVRRRVAEDVMWLPLRYPDDIFQGDLIFTGEKSETEIEFPDGTKLNISPESLVIVQTIDGKAALDLQLGNVSGSLGAGSKGVVLTSGGQKTMLKAGADGEEPAKISLKVDAKGKAAITVLDGEVHVASNGKEQKMEKNQKIEVSKEAGLSDVKTFAVELLTPSSDAVLWQTARNKGQRFAWRTKGKTQNFLIEISREENFKSPVVQKKIRGSTTTLSRLPPGPVYWRVIGIPDRGQKQTESPPQRFTIQQNVAPEPVYPLDRQTVELVRTDPPPPPTVDGKPRPEPVGHLASSDDDSIRLRWNDPVGSKNYRVQVSTTRRFGKVLWDESVASTTVKTPGLTAGRFFWRVKSEDEKRPSSEWSVIAQFRVTEKFVGTPLKAVEPTPPRDPPLPPQLIDKNLGFEVSKWIEPILFHPVLRLVFEFESRAFGADGPEFKWRPVKAIDRYRLEISREKDFSDELVVVESDETTAEWDDPKLGDYRWRVKSVDDDGVMSKPSDTGTLKVTAAPPGGREYEFEVTRDIPLPMVDLEWDENSYADGYEIQISAHETFLKPTSKKVTDTEVQVELPEWKDHYWRIRSLDANGRPIGRFGEVVLLKTPPQPGPSPEELKEQRRLQEEQRLTEQRILAEKKRLEAEQKLVEMKKAAELKKVAGLKKVSEQQRLAAAKRAADLKRRKQELARKKQLEAEQRKVAETKKRKQQKALQSKRRKAEQEELAEKKRQVRRRVAEAREQDGKEGEEEKPKKVATRQPSSERSKSEMSVDRIERPDFMKPQNAIVGIGGGFATGDIIQSKDASAAGVTQFPDGEASGTTFQMVYLDAEYFPLSYFGIGADFVYGNLVASDGSNSGSMGGLEIPFLDFGFDIRGRWNPFNQLSLMGGIGMKRIGQFYFLDQGGTTTTVDNSSYSLLETFIVDWLPFDQTFMIRGRVDFTQGFTDFPGNISIMPSIDVRKWFGKFYVGLKLYRQSRNLSIEIRVPPTNVKIGNASTDFEQTMFLVMFGMGF